MSSTIVASATLNVVKTDTLKIHVADLPIASTQVQFMYQMIEPMKLIPKTHSISSMLSCVNGFDYKEVLAQHILGEWKITLREAHGPNVLPELQWMHDIQKVELVPCELIVPNGEPSIVKSLPYLGMVQVIVPGSKGQPDRFGYVNSDTWRDVEAIRAGEVVNGGVDVYQYCVRVPSHGAESLENLRHAATKDPRFDTGVKKASQAKIVT